MFSIPVGDVAAVSEVVLQRGLDKETDVGREIVLDAETQAYRPLHIRMELSSSRLGLGTIGQQIVALKGGVQRQVEGGAGRGINVQSLRERQMVRGADGDAKILQRLVLLQGDVAVARTEIAGQARVVETRSKLPMMIEPIVNRQRQGKRQVVMGNGVEDSGVRLGIGVGQLHRATIVEVAVGEL